MKRRLLLLLTVVVVGSPALSGLTLDEALRGRWKEIRAFRGQDCGEQAAGQRLVFRSSHARRLVRVPLACKGASAPEPPNRPFALARGFFFSHSFKREFRLVAAWRHRSADPRRVKCCGREQLHEVRTAFYTAPTSALEELGRSQRQRLDENLTSERRATKPARWTAARSPPRLCRPRTRSAN
jgi:hypothetical protein